MIAYPHLPPKIWIDLVLAGDDAAIIAAGYHPREYRMLRHTDKNAIPHTDRGAFAGPIPRWITATEKPCPICKAPAGHLCIRMPARKMPDYLDQQYQQQAQRRRREYRRRVGQCADCRNDAEPGKRRCRDHLAAARNRARLRRRPDACLDCAAAPEPGKRRCAIHLAAAVNTARRRKAGAPLSEDDAHAHAA